MNTLNYKSAGVDVAMGNQFVDRLKRLNTQKGHEKQIISGIGGFASLYELPIQDYQEPVLVSATDGVGTKLKLAIELNQHHTVGIDLVAMCANDLIVCGAKPLYFLDYYAVGQLELEQASAILEGIVTGCEQANMALMGGETAEMPGLYQIGDYDLAGFAVGIVEKSKIIRKDQVKPGDKLIGLASSGVHSNGFSLVRKILEINQIALSTPFLDATLGEALLAPTKIYVKSLLKLQDHLQPHALAHITGGGLVENIPRVLPDDLSAQLEKSSWTMPPILEWIAETGRLEEQEMFQTFNCGLGMILCVAPEDVESSLGKLKECGEQAWLVGEIIKKSDPQSASVIIE